MRGGGALLHFDDGALELVACTDAHEVLAKCLAVRGCATRVRPCVEMRKRDRRPTRIRNAYGVTAPDISSFCGAENSPRASTLSWLGVRRVQDRFAVRWQLRHRDLRLGLGWHYRRLRMEDRILEPVGEVGGLAAVATLLVFLAVAFGGARRTAHADVEVIVMAPPRPD